MLKQRMHVRHTPHQRTRTSMVVSPPTTASGQAPGRQPCPHIIFLLALLMPDDATTQSIKTRSCELVSGTARDRKTTLPGENRRLFRAHTTRICLTDGKRFPSKSVSVHQFLLRLSHKCDVGTLEIHGGRFTITSDDLNFPPRLGILQLIALANVCCRFAPSDCKTVACGPRSRGATNLAAPLSTMASMFAQRVP